MRGLTPLDLFEKRCDAMANALAQVVPQGAPAVATSFSGICIQYFFEAYWTNLIEGSELSIGEAQQVFAVSGYQPDTHAKRLDGFDLLGTAQSIRDQRWCAINPTNPTSWNELLRSRHNLVMAHRPEKLPGQWRDDDVMVGDKTFMPPKYVPEALLAGHAWITRCEPGLPRAIMTMWVIADVHPFRDGNGRASRLAMNAELSRHGLARIFVAENLREKMLAGLSRMSNRRKPDKLIQAMIDIQDWTLSIDWFDHDTALAQLKSQGITDGTELSEEEIQILQNDHVSEPALTSNYALAQILPTISNEGDRP